MAVIHIERGRIIETLPEVVSCLWENWDIYDALLDKKFNVQKQREGVWTASRKGLKVKIELIPPVRKSLQSGIFKYLISVSKPKRFWLPVKTIATLTYSATSTGKTSVMGIGDMEVGGFAALMRKMGERLGNKLADEAIEGGDIACTMISKNLEKAREKLTGEQQEILDKYLKEAILARESRMLQKRDVADNILNIVPINNKRSLVRLETSVPKRRRIREKVEVGEKIDGILAGCDEMVRSANVFETLSRNPEETSDRTDLLSSGQEFYGEAIKLGQELYSSYIPEDIHAYLTSMLDYGGDIRLKIETEGRDSALPWELLHNRVDFLCLRIGLARIVTEVVRLANKALDFRGVLIVGSNPRNDLENVEREAIIVFQALANIKGIDKKLLSGRDATKENVIDEIETGKYQVLHYCGHSGYNKENPGLSFLLLDEERKLMADELARLSGDTGLQLVFLNSCLSGVTGGFGVGVTGLTDSFVKVGVPYVIGMLWRVSDQGASALAEEFYDKLSKLKDPVEALRRARLRVGGMFDWKDPIWAAPVIYTQ